MRITTFQRIAAAAVMTTVATATVVAFASGEPALPSVTASPPQAGGGDVPRVALPDSTSDKKRKPAASLSATADDRNVQEAAAPSARRTSTPPAAKAASAKPAAPSPKPDPTTSPSPGPTPSPTPTQKNLLEVLLGQ